MGTRATYTYYWLYIVSYYINWVKTSWTYSSIAFLSFLWKGKGKIHAFNSSTGPVVFIWHGEYKVKAKKAIHLPKKNKNEKPNIGLRGP